MTLREIARRAALLPRPAVFPARVGRPVSVRQAWGRYACVRLVVPPNRWCVGLLPIDDFDLASLWADFCTVHFAPWHPVPDLHFSSPLPELPPEWLELASALEACLNCEHELGLPGLCPRANTLLPGCVYTRPRREILAATERMLGAFDSFRVSNAHRSAQIQTLLGQLIAQCSDLAETHRQIKGHFAQAAALRELDDTARLLRVLATVPCNSRGQIDRRSAAEHLGATPEQLARLFPVPPPEPPPEPPAWLPDVKAALEASALHLFSAQDASRCRSLARTALNQLNHAFA